MKEKPIWCRDIDANGTCSSVMHYRLTEGNFIPVSEYMLIGLAKTGKLKTSFTEVFSEAGLCMTFNEAYAKALATFVATNDFAHITPDDQPFSEKAQIEFNAKMMEPLRSVFGKEYCGRYEISKHDAAGKISEIKATFFIEGAQQPFPFTLYTLFPEHSDNVRLRTTTQ